MSVYETTAKVEDHGRIRLAGVPFEPGTEVAITIEPAPHGGPVTASPPALRAARLFAALDKARNTEPIGTLHREELYDRKVLR